MLFINIEKSIQGKAIVFMLKIVLDTLHKLWSAKKVNKCHQNNRNDRLKHKKKINLGK